jgi:hypothetical protein
MPAFIAAGMRVARSILANQSIGPILLRFATSTKANRRQRALFLLQFAVVLRVKPMTTVLEKSEYENA